MPVLKVSKQDILRSQLLDEGYYKAKVVDVKAAQSAKGTSVNFKVQFELEGTDGRLQTYNLNSMMVGTPENLRLISLLTGASMEDAKDMEFDTDTFIGKKVQVKVIKDTYEGRIINSIDDFVPYDKDTTVGF